MAGATSGPAAGPLRELFGGGSVVGLGDEQLLARYAATGDGSAFEALVVRHGPMVLATCRTVLRDDHDAEDAFQATFLILARRAGSVRMGGALGGWLHRVARRAAIQAGARSRRRRRVEAAAAVPVASAPGPDPELRPILHEEIGRLPERHRLPVILCDLEGLTYEQAAERLRWTEPTLRCRLARARQGLRTRLARRGIAAPAVMAPAAAPTLSPALVRSAVAAAGVSAPAGVAMLTSIVLRGMLMTRIKIASTAALAALSVAAAGAITAGDGRQVDPQAAPKPAPAANENPSAGEVVRVLDPEGRPAAGAKVYRSDARFGSLDPEGRPAMPLAEVGPDGTFRLAPGDEETAWTRPGRILARAPETGPAFADPSVGDGLRVLRLVRDDVPIRGRILDSDGRPVAGASVQVVGILWHPSGKLDEWLAALAEEKVAFPVEYRLLRSWASDNIPSLFPPVATDRDGRFAIRGVGRERVASLLISGPGIETRFEYAATRDMPTVTVPNFARQNQGQMITYHGAVLNLVAGPGLEVVGTVRDKDTGLPLAGAVVQTTTAFGNPLRFLRATANAEGRYRLPGVPPKTHAGFDRENSAGFDQEVLASTKDGTPYLPSVQSVGPGPGVVTRDFALKRGLWARGRVTDGATGRPVRASLNYFIPTDNPYLEGYPTYDRLRVADPFQTDEDGRFRIVVIPGPGVLGARADKDAYRLGVGLDKIPGLKELEEVKGYYSTTPDALVPVNYNALVAIEPRVGDESVTADVVLDPGRTLKGSLVGPDGEPVTGARMLGAKDLFLSWSHEPLPSAEFEVHALGPNSRRGLLFYHVGKKLAGSYVVGPGEAGPVTVKLVPSGSLSGRLVDDDGRPRAGIQMTCDRPYTEDDTRFEIGSLTTPVVTGSDGRFRADGLVPGLRYSLAAWEGRMKVGYAVRDAVAGPGESRDLGDVRVPPPPKPED